MKKYLLSAAVALAAMVPAASAIAADLDTVPPPPVEHLRPSAYDWSGAYVGLWAGAACLDGRGSLTDNGAIGGPFVWNNGGCGIKGGGMLGYNHQIDNIVFGAEVDLGTTGDIVRNNENIGGQAADFRFGMNYLSTFRGRVGWAQDDTLFYITAGGAYAQGVLNSISGAAPPNNLTADSWGWSVGGGIEHAVTDNFRLRLEYLYTQFGDTHYASGCCDIDWKWGGEHEVKIGAIYAF
jgi:outer membrane immunogenic protein